MKGPKNGIIKASFSGCAVDERKKFKQAHGMLLISVGQKYHEDEKFIATLKLVSKKFQKFTVMVADTLQRHNIQSSLGLNAKEAYMASRKNGDEWIKKYYNNIIGSEGFEGIRRWDEYLASNEFEITKVFLEKEISKNNSIFCESINATIAEYMARQNRSILPSSKKIELEYNCKRYLIEECAIMLLWVKEDFNFEIYPALRNQAMATIYEEYIKPYHVNVLVPVNLRFKRYAKVKEAVT